MPSTTTNKRGQVVVVNVTFAGQTGSKLRPALVASVDAFHQKLLEARLRSEAREVSEAVELAPAPEVEVPDAEVSALRQLETLRERR